MDNANENTTIIPDDADGFEDLLGEAIVMAEADLELDEVDDVLCVVQPTKDLPRWTWFLQLKDGRFACVSVICPASISILEDPEVTICAEKIGIARAACQAHAAQFISFVERSCADGDWSFCAEADRLVLTVTATEPIPAGVKIVLVLLAVNVLVVGGSVPITHDGDRDPVRGLPRMSLYVNSAGAFISEREGDREPLGIETIGLGEIYALHFSWCMDNELGAIVWCAAARRRVPRPETEARLRAAGYDLEALGRGILPWKSEIGTSSTEMVTPSGRTWS
jgi:hypothetical protein